MSQGLTTDLGVAALCTWLFGFYMARRSLSRVASFLLATIKVAIPTIYFGWYFNADWNFLDDVSYESQGRELLHLGYNPITTLTDPAGLAHLVMMSGGNHFLYGWWNVVGQFFFGEHYFAAVFLNVGLTFVAGYFLFQLVVISGFSVRYAKALLGFFLLQWEVLAWSSLINLKDILVMTLTVMAIYFIVQLYQRITPGRVAGLIFVVFVFLWIRFYITLDLVITIVLWVLIGRNSKRKLLFVLLAGLMGVVVVRYLQFGELVRTAELFDVSEMAAGIFHMALTPQPWAIEPSYTFLFLPSILHWVLFVPALVGCWWLWRSSRTAQLTLIYLLVTFSTYGSTDFLQGPRERVQDTFIIAWAQFHFLWVFCSAALHFNPGLPGGHPHVVRSELTVSELNLKEATESSVPAAEMSEQLLPPDDLTALSGPP